MPRFNRKSLMGGLCMTRKVGERIIINNGELIIEVVETRGRYVRLAFKSHKEITIQREPKPATEAKDDDTSNSG